MVYFVCRSEYENPLGFRRVEFPHETILEWFQDFWVSSEDKMPESCLEWFGFDLRLYGINSLWERMAACPGGAPKSTRKLNEFIQSEPDYSEGVIAIAPNAVQALTNDDEIEVVWYLFDHAYLEKHPERAAFLMRDELILPENSNENGKAIRLPGYGFGKRTKGQGSTSCAFICGEDSANITEGIGVWEAKGVKLPDFACWLANQEVPISHESWGTYPQWPDALILLRAYAVVSDEQPLLADILQRMEREKTQPMALASVPSLSSARSALKDPALLIGDRKKCLCDFARFFKFREAEFAKYHRRRSPRTLENIFRLTEFQFSDHVIRLNFVTSGYTNFVTSWIFFDSDWAAAHPDLAKSTTRYAARWDLLFDTDLY